MRTADSAPMLLNYVLLETKVIVEVTRTTGQLLQVLPIPCAPVHGEACNGLYRASQHLTSAPFATDLCPVQHVAGDFVCPVHALVVCNSMPGLHWEQCRPLPTDAPDASRTRSHMGIPGLPVTKKLVAQFPRQTAAGTVFCGKALQNLACLFPPLDE